MFKGKISHPIWHPAQYWREAGPPTFCAASVIALHLFRMKNPKNHECTPKVTQWRPLFITTHVWNDACLIFFFGSVSDSLSKNYCDYEGRYVRRGAQKYIPELDKVVVCRSVRPRWISVYVYVRSLNYTFTGTCSSFGCTITGCSSVAAAACSSICPRSTGT